MIAFLTWLAEAIGPDSRFVHLGMTSSDVLDTCLSVQLAQAADLLIADVDALLAALRGRAFEHKHTLTIGRSHGIHAEPTSFGLKLAGHYAEFARNRVRLVQARAEIAVCAISARGQARSPHVDPRVEAFAVAERLGLARWSRSRPEVIPRDQPLRRSSARSAWWPRESSGWRREAAAPPAQARCARRRSSSTRARRVSSAMPHKRNPVLSENLTGLARLVRAAVTPALENVALWHERDISHSSVERAIAPDATVTLDFALARLADMMGKLTIYPERMLANLEALGGVVHSGEVLLALARAGVLREDAYRIVQRAAMRTWTELGRPGGQGFRANLDADPEIAGRVAPEVLDAAMDPAPHLRELDRVFGRVFGEAGPGCPA